MTATMDRLPTTLRVGMPSSFVAIATKGWHPDPLQLHDLRYHDGGDWTEHVTHYGPVPCDCCHPASF